MLTAVLLLFVTHVVGGVAAFGSTLLALPLLLLAGWELRPAVGLLVIVGCVQAAQVAAMTWRALDRRALTQVVVLAGAGLPVGFATAARLPQRSLGVLLGVVLVAAGASHLREQRTGRAWEPPAWVLRVLLLAGGVIHGAFGSGGATLTVYARYVLKDKAAFRATLSTIWTVLNSFVIVGLWRSGALDHRVGVTALAGVPTVLLATWVGDWLVRRLSQEQFARLVALLLCVAGVLTVGRNAG